MSVNLLDRYRSEGRSLNKLDILAESVGPGIILPEEGHYSRKRRQSISPSNKSKMVKLKQPENQQQQIIEEISKLNRLIRFKSQLIKKKYDRDEPDLKQLAKNPTSNSTQPKQIYLRYESNYSPKVFLELVLNIKKEQHQTEFLSTCFPELLHNLNAVVSPSKKRYNVQKQIKYRSNEVKQSFLHNFNNPHVRAKSEVTLPPKSIEKEHRVHCQLASHWQDILKSIVIEQNGSNVFLYIMTHNFPLFIGYVSYSLGLDKVVKGEYSINFDRVYIIDSFRKPVQQELITNLFKTLIKHQLLGKAERWGWRMAAFKRKHYILVYGE